MKAHLNTLPMTRRRFLTVTAQSAVVLALPAYEFSQAHLAHAAVTYQPGVYYFSDWNPELDPRNTVNSQRLYFLGDNWYSGIRESLTEPDPLAYGPVPDREPLLGWYDDRQQSIMDQQILQAASRGLDHFAFYYYWNMYGGGQENPGQEAIHNFTQSSNKSLLHFYVSFVVTGNWPASDWNSLIVPQLVAFMQDSQYKKTPDGRPILSVIGADSLNGGSGLSTALQQLRTAAQAKGLPNPFLVSTNNPNQNDINAGYDGFAPFPGPDNSSSSWQMFGNGESQFNFRPWLAGGGYCNGNIWATDESSIGGVNGVISTPRTPNTFRSNDLASAKNLLDTQANSLGIATFYAWSETGEGGMIQPSTYFGYGFLNAIQDVFGLSNAAYKTFIAAHSLSDLDPAVRLEFAPDTSWHVVGDTMTVAGSLKNNTSAAISGSVTLTAPSGWNVTSSSGTGFTNLAVGASQAVSFTVTVGSGNLWDKNTFTITATYGGSQTVSTTVFVVLANPLYGLIKPIAPQTTSGGSVPLTIRVRNYTKGSTFSGSYTISAPSGWSVSSGSGSISNLGANSTVDLTGPTLTVPSGTAPGYYELDLTVTVSGSTYPSATRVNVSGDTAWHWWGSSSMDFSDAEGWTGGYNNNFNATYSSSSTASLVSPGSLGINAATNHYVRLALRNISASGLMQLSFITTTDTVFNNAKSVLFLTTPQDKMLQVINLDMSINPLWTGTIQQIALTPGGSPLMLKEVYITSSANLALEKSATASGFYASNATPGRAVDGTLGLNAKWTSDTAAGDKWLQVDLGQSYFVNRWVVQNAGAGGETSLYNTVDYQLQYYNGSSWIEADAVTGNTANVTNRSLPTAINAQLVRLYITNPNQGMDTIARIDEFELYGGYAAVNGPNPTGGLTIPNNGFEAPTTSTYIYNPTGGSWIFTGSSGVSANNSAFTNKNPNAPEGVQVAFLQETGSFSQSISGFQASTPYVVSFYVAQRGYNVATQNFQILLDGTSLGTFTPGSTSYSLLTTQPFTTTAGSHTLHFVGLDSAGGDNTVFIDDVVIATSGIQDSGFESPTTSTYIYNPTGSPWTFLGGTGVATNGSLFTSNNPNAPQGSQVAFLQNLGTISQGVVLGAGNCVVSFQAAQRVTSGNNDQSFHVLIDGVVAGTFQPTTSTYQSYSTGSFAVSAGNHLLTFQGLIASGDETAFIDAVTISIS